MTIDQLDLHVKKYLNYLKTTRTIRNMGDVYYKIRYSKKSKSFYLKLCVIVNNKPYRKTLRFSDHERFNYDTYPQKFKGIIINSGKEISKHQRKYIEATIRKEIQRLQYGAGISTVYNFKADA